MKKFQLRSFLSGVLFSALIISLIGTAAATLGQRTLTVDYTDIKIQLDGKQITPTDANGNAVEPFAVNGTTYLPVRAVSNALGLGVNWNAATSTVELTSPKSDLPYDIHDCYADFSVPAFENIVGYHALVDVYDLTTGDSRAYYYDPLSFETAAGVDNYAAAYMELLEYYGFERNPARENGDILYENSVSGMIVSFYWVDATASTSDMVCILVMAPHDSTTSSTQTGSPSYTPSAAELRAAYEAEVDEINSYYDAQVQALREKRDKEIDDRLATMSRVNGGLSSDWMKISVQQTVDATYSSQFAGLEAARDTELKNAKEKYGQ